MFIDFVDYPVEKEEHRVLNIEQFYEDFSSLLWLTYRKQFPQLDNSSLTTDCGWGCMLRTGQMLLANTLLIHMLKESKWIIFLSHENELMKEEEAFSTPYVS